MQRQFRLRHSADFQRLRAEGKTWRHPFFTLSAAPNTLPTSRFGFIISRRVGNAVVRNRVRRLLREAVRHALPRLKAGFDIVFIVRNEIVNQPYSEVCQTLEQMFKRAKLWQEE